MNRKEQPKPVSDTQHSDHTDNRVEQRHQKQSQVAQLSAANVEESPHMDRGDSEGGSGQSLPGGDDRRAGESQKRGAIDTQYGTKSASKRGGAEQAAATDADNDSSAQSPNPGSSEQSSGSERDTMSGPRPGSGD